MKPRQRQLLTTPDEIFDIVKSFMRPSPQNLGKTMRPEFGLDTEFYNGAYPDSILTHVTIADAEGSCLIIEAKAPEQQAALAEAWKHTLASEALFFTHYGQDDLMLLERAGCHVENVWDSGIIANHLSLLTTALKELALEYKIADEVMTYARLLDTVIPPDEKHLYLKAGQVIQAYDLTRVPKASINEQITLDYCAQDGFYGLQVARHMRDVVLPSMYAPETQAIIEEAQFGTSILLARYNAKGYTIDEDILKATIDSVQAEVDELEKRGRAMVREAMEWDKPAIPDAMELLRPSQPVPVPLPMINPDRVTLKLDTPILADPNPTPEPPREAPKRIMLRLGGGAEILE